MLAQYLLLVVFLTTVITAAGAVVIDFHPMMLIAERIAEIAEGIR